jgi:hypothetical protein
MISSLESGRIREESLSITPAASPSAFTDFQRFKSGKIGKILITIVQIIK